MSSVRRLPIVGVLGSHSQESRDRAEPLGRWLATIGVHLLTGGGPGAMQTISRAFAETPQRQGMVLGIVPAASAPPPLVVKLGYPNPWVEVAIQTHLHQLGSAGDQPLSRNHLVVATSTLLVALPGAEGTLSEVRLALQYNRPLIAFLHDRSEIPGLPDEIRVTAELEQIQAFVVDRLTSPGNERSENAS